MKLRCISVVVLFVAALFFSAAPLRADVKDNASIFSKQAVDDASRDMKKMKDNHNKEFVVETFSTIPDDQKDAYAQNKDGFFRTWETARAQELKVNGVYALICMDPHHLEVDAGKNTRAHGDFTQQDIDGLKVQMRDALKNKDYDKALTDAVGTVERAYTANISEPGNRSSSAARETEYSSGHSGASPVGSSTSWGSIICMIVGAVIIFSLIKSIFRGNSGGGYGGFPQGGGYGGNAGPGYGNPGYGQPGYGAGGGGGGFGRGFLGGLLGGALGGYAADRWDRRNDQSGGYSQGGGTGPVGGGGGGGSFDSGPSDAGQGFGDAASGGDFGSSGGGSSGGGDSGGGGSSGGDF